MTFDEALSEMRKGKFVAREIWDGMFLRYVVDYSEPIGKRSEIIATVDGNFYLWRVIQADILADDWIVINDRKGENANEKNG